MLDAWDFKKTQFIVGISKNGAVKHLPVQTKSRASKVVETLSRCKWDVYWAMAGFEGSSRLASKAATIPAFWVDLDCGKDKPYKNWKEALNALLKWVQHHKMLPPTHVVRSGNGLHIYWLLSSSVTHSEWLPVAQSFKRSLRVGDHAVKADPQRTADAASILRVPGTYNYKDPENPKKVELIFSKKNRYSLQQFKNALPATGPRELPAGKPDISPEWAIPADYPPSSANKIAANCPQIAYFKEKGGAVSEPYWRAGLSIIKRCEQGNELIHEWSQGDERYDSAETQRKADGTKGPATCEHFEDVNPGGCAGCKAGVTSPIQLGVTIKTPEVAQNEDWKLSEVFPYKVTEEGIWIETEGEPAKKICHVPIWIQEIREKERIDTESDASSLMLAWKGIDGKPKRGVVYQAQIHDTKEFKKWAANHNIISGMKEPGSVMKYISQYTMALMKKKGATAYHENLGWCNDGFVIGDTLVTKDGTKNAMVQSTNPIHKLKPQGDLSEWKKAAKILDQPKYNKHALSLLLGFASPIFALADVNSAIISLVGRSGSGKTLAAQFALSIYGDPKLLMQNASATDNAIEQQLVANHHVPHLLDEVSNYKASRLANYVYTAANGQGKSALNRSRGFKEAGEWRLTPFITSNQPLLEMSQSDIQEAHRRRLLELPFSTEFPQEEALTVYQTMTQNFGVAGVEYLKQLNKMRGDIPRMFQQALAQIRKIVNLPEANRFGQWSLAAAYLGGHIAKSIGLIDYDVDKIIKRAMRVLEDNVEETQSYDELALDAVREFVTKNSKRVCFWESSGRDMGVPTDDPIARVDNGTVAIHVKELNDELLERGISRGLIKEWMQTVLIQTKAVRLAPGCPPVRAYIMKDDIIGIKKMLEE